MDGWIARRSPCLKGAAMATKNRQVQHYRMGAASTQPRTRLLTHALVLTMVSASVKFAGPVPAALTVSQLHRAWVASVSVRNP